MPASGTNWFLHSSWRKTLSSWQQSLSMHWGRMLVSTQCMQMSWVFWCSGCTKKRRSGKPLLYQMSKPKWNCSNQEARGWGYAVADRCRFTMDVREQKTTMCSNASLPRFCFRKHRWMGGHFGDWWTSAQVLPPKLRNCTSFRANGLHLLRKSPRHQIQSPWKGN